MCKPKIRILIMRVLLLIMCVLAGYIKVFPQSYYYYNNERIPLQQHPYKMVRAFPEKTGGIQVLSKERKDKMEIAQEMISYGSKKGEKNLCSSDTDILLQSCVRTYPCYISAEGQELYPDGYVNIKLSNKIDSSALLKVLEDFDCTDTGQNKFMPAWHIVRLNDSNTSDPVEVANAIHETGIFEAVSPGFIVDNPYNDYGLSYDAHSSEQKSLLNEDASGCDINISRAWNYSTGWGIKIAIIDSGIDLSHPDLEQNLYPVSYDATFGVSPSSLYDIGDNNSYRPHGTHCAGIAAAARNNGIGISGVAPDAQLISISVHPDYVPNSGVVFADAINWAWMNGADVLSCSWECAKSEILDDAIINATTLGRGGLGCVLVFSAGNHKPQSQVVNNSLNNIDGVVIGGWKDSAVVYPALREDVLAVGNVTSRGIINEGSCYGNGLDVVAPGTDIYSSIPDGYGRKNGTSMACPHVAGTAALLLSRNPFLSEEEVRDILCMTAKKIGKVSYSENMPSGAWSNIYGYGLVDAYNALMQVESEEY
ncbi:MAG: S8 family serine peptidase [Muribaculaceae bacterium]|nr:S8 family serine peptidase [Muribaculaceae bacterium]